MNPTIPKLEIIAPTKPEYGQILTPEALQFVADLNNRFNQTRLDLLARRKARQAEINAGKVPTFLAETAFVRSGDWQVAACPTDLQDRRVEITGPVERKMMINALNSGAKVFMADIEDSLSPTWANVVDGQICLYEAVRRKLTFTSPEGKAYKLNDEIAVLLVRPRGWHLDEAHVLMDGKPVSASLFDFGLYFFHNVKELIARGTGPYFYLPKMENHLEARLWAEVFAYAEQALQITDGTIRATALLETILAAFEMEEILYELRDYASGLNAGRWDYIFSIVKKFGSLDGYVLPERSQVTMNVPFMRAYCDLLVNTCHRRGAHAMGGMAAFIPSRRDAAINEVAMARVTEDKERETRQGFDGTWVAHPDLVALAKKVFGGHFGDKPNQKDNLRPDVKVEAAQLIDLKVDGGKISEAGLRNNVDVALQYLESWLRGVGAAAIHNLMEDAATAEISRAQLWQWIKNQSKLDDGRVVTRELYSQIAGEEIARLMKGGEGRYKEAASVLDSLVLNDQFVDFLTLPAYELIKTTA